MGKHAKVLLILTVLIVLFIAILPNFTAATEGHSEVSLSQTEEVGVAVTRKAIAKAGSEDGMVEVLIILKEQVNTEAVATMTRKKTTIFNRSSSSDKGCC